jgi:hypothetical protein
MRAALSRLVRRTRLACVMGMVAVVALAACTSGVTDDPALGALMRIEGAQFVHGAMPAVSTAAPTVASIDLATNTIWPGEIDKSLTGALGASATAAAIALSGDEGYWIVPAGVPDFSAPTLPTFLATASFAATLSPGPYALQIRAVDASGAFGAPSTQTLTALAAPPSGSSADGAKSALVVSLAWDTEADLDLHVDDPDGNEIYHGDPLTTSADGGVAGELDFDSNANCVIDGRRQEDVTWTSSPPSGHYRVLVDAASLCGQSIAHWTVHVTLRGADLGSASGVALDSDTWGPHDRGDGLLALAFDVP